MKSKIDEARRNIFWASVGWTVLFFCLGYGKSPQSRITNESTVLLLTTMPSHVRTARVKQLLRLGNVILKKRGEAMTMTISVGAAVVTKVSAHSFVPNNNEMGFLIVEGGGSL
jgi:hypothetical protein